MSGLVLLTLVSVLGAAALFVALVNYLRLIVRELEATGGPTTRFARPENYLAKIRMGVRAIEVQTGHIVPEVTRLNGGLTAIRDGLKAIDQNLAGVIAAVQHQEGR